MSNQGYYQGGPQPQYPQQRYVVFIYSSARATRLRCAAVCVAGAIPPLCAYTHTRAVGG